MDTTNRKPDKRFNARGPFPEGTHFWQSESDALFIVIWGTGMFRSDNGKLYLIASENAGRLASNFSHAGLQLSFEKYLSLLEENINELEG